MGAIISVEGLGKKYRIRHGQQNSERGYKTFRDLLSTLPRKFKARLTPSTQRGAGTEDFWALRDVSFEVQPGDRVGIIGRNGAGKSTLLKLLSRITEPSVGRITLRGRVASLLEVGTGFHPELTGRENIFLNGAILGMSKAEVKRKFEEIVDFSGVEKFLDTPVKRYSSGMYVRLAFAVAAHLEPEILVVDEVLAVGDAEFQKKCLGKMEAVGKEGRTVLFVSHNMGAVHALCTKALVLDNGCLTLATSDVHAATARYLLPQRDALCWETSAGDPQNEYFRPLKMYLTHESGALLEHPAHVGEIVLCHIEGEVLNEHPAFNVGIAIYSDIGECMAWSFTTDGSASEWPSKSTGFHRYVVKIPGNILNEGRYKVEFLASIHCVEWIYEPYKSPVSVLLNYSSRFSDSPLWLSKRPGMLAPLWTWTDAN